MAFRIFGPAQAQKTYYTMQFKGSLITFRGLSFAFRAKLIIGLSISTPEFHIRGQVCTLENIRFFRHRANSLNSRKVQLR